MATLAVQQITQEGLDPSLAAADAAGDKCLPGERSFIRVANGGGSPVTVTVDSVRLSNYGTDVDLVVAVPAGEERWIGPIPSDRFASSSDGLVAWSYSDTTSVTVGAVRI